MKVFTLFTAFVLTHITGLASAIAIDKRQGGDGGNCQWTVDITYNVADEIKYYEPRVQITGVQVGPDPAGGAITVSYSYSKSFSVNANIIGVFDPKKAIGIVSGNTGVTAGVSVTWTEGTSISGVQDCPANAICGLTASAHMVKVTGTIYQQWSTPGASGLIYYDPASLTNPPCNNPTNMNDLAINKDIPFEAHYPIIAQASKVNGQDQMETEFQVCAYETFAGLLPCPTGTPAGPPK